MREQPRSAGPPRSWPIQGAPGGVAAARDGRPRFAPRPRALENQFQPNTKKLSKRHSADAHLQIFASTAMPRHVIRERVVVVVDVVILCALTADATETSDAVFISPVLAGRTDLALVVLERRQFAALFAHASQH